MKILLIGKSGQIGYALNKKLSSLGEVIATDRSTLDLSNLGDLKSFIDKIKPNIIINASAYTDVDKAETEVEMAYKINVEAPKVLVEKAKAFNIPLIHFSTDYVFDGFKKKPYLETDVPNPQSVYGKTKWEGEKLIRLYEKHIILRTSWVFGSHGQNFLKTILKLIKKKSSLKIMSEEKGAPTSVSLIASAVYKIVKTIMDQPDFMDFGTYHLTSDGYTTWHQYACFIADEARNLNFKTNMTSKTIKAVSNSEELKLASRPLNSRLNTKKIKNTFMLELPRWQDDVRKVIQEIIK